MQATGYEREQASASLRGNDWVALMATCLVDISILVFAAFKPRQAFHGPHEAGAWFRANLANQESFFSAWYSQYQFDYRGSHYIVRPTPFWTRSGRGRNDEMPMEQMVMMARPLIEKRLLVEIKPKKALLTLAQHVLNRKGWNIETPHAPANVYKVVSSGLAQLYEYAQASAGKAHHLRSTSPTSGLKDRPPGR